MAHALLATVASTMIGLLAPKLGDRLRTPLFGGKPCDKTQAGGAVWRYSAEAPNQEAAWQPVRDPAGC